jgi:hypothetical protein
MDFVLLIKHGIVGYLVSLSVLVNALTVNKFLLYCHATTYNILEFF